MRAYIYTILILVLFANHAVAEIFEVSIYRTHHSPLGYTTGELYIDGNLVLLTLEDNKEKLLPAGTYQGKIRRKDINTIIFDLNNGKKVVLKRNGKNKSLGQVRLGLAVDNTPKLNSDGGSDKFNNIKYEREAFNIISSITPEADGTEIRINIYDSPKPIIFTRESPNQSAKIDLERTLIEQIDTTWRWRELLIVDGKVKEYFPESKYEESYRTTDYIVFKAIQPDSTPPRFRLEISGGCMHMNWGEKWMYKDSRTFERKNNEQLKKSATCDNLKHNEWYKDIKIYRWDPYNIGQLHAASGTGFKRILSTLRVEGDSPNIGKLYAIVDSADLSKIEDSGFLGHLVDETILNQKLVMQWRNYFKNQNAQEKTPFILSIIGIFSTSASVVGASFDLLSSLSSTEYVTTDALSHLMAVGGKFRNILKVRRNSLSQAYIYHDLYYTVTVAEEERNYLVYSSRYALKEE